MTTKQLLSRAAGLIDKKGLARETACKDGAYCLVAALIESSYDTERGKRVFKADLYANARNVLAGVLGLNSSYQALVDYNDDYRTDKTGKKTYKHDPVDIVREIRRAAELAEDPVKKVNTKPK